MELLQSANARIIALQRQLTEKESQVIALQQQLGDSQVGHIAMRG